MRRRRHGAERVTTDPVRPALYFDFVDPGSWILSRAVDAAGGAGLVEWKGFELRPPPEPMIDPGDEAWRARIAVVSADFGSELPHDVRPESGAGILPGSALELPTIVPWTRKAHELCEFARARDCFDAVRRTLFRARFVDRIDIGRIDLLVEIGGRAGLDRSETKAVLDVDRYAATVLRHRVEARRMGVGDVPALVSASGRLEGSAELRDIERAIRRLDTGADGHNQEE